MPGKAEITTGLNEILFSMRNLPDIAGLPSSLWMPMLVIGAVIGYFILGNPARSR